MPLTAMPDPPYRTPAPAEPEPARAPAEIGALCSVHTPPPLHRALLGPLLIAAVACGVAFVAGVPIAVVLLVGVLGLAIQARAPIRLRGLSVELHDKGVVVSWPGDRREVAFEDVDEVWFELERVHNQPGASLDALRLVTFQGGGLRVPLGVEGASLVAGAVLRACSGPLLGEARQALAEGVTLRFGRIQIDRRGIAERSLRLAWSEVGLAVVQRGKIHLYKRWPIVPSLTVRLDCVPNPTVLTGVLTACVSNVRVDDAIVIPFATAAEEKRAFEAARGSELALRTMLGGGVLIVCGVAVTLASYSPRDSTHWVGLVPVALGVVRVVQGLRAYRKR